jgi:ABC-2 type transport system permease protein
MKQLGNVWFIMLKDLKVFATDRLALFFFILFPFVFIVIFNFIMADIGVEDERLSLHLITQEPPGGLSYQLISSMETKDTTLLQTGEPEIIWDKDYAQAIKDVEDKKLNGFLAFPADFTQGVMMGYGTRLEVVINPTASSTRAALNGLASNIASQVGAQQLASNIAVSMVVEERLVSGDVLNLGTEIQEIIMAPANPTTQPPAVSFVTENIGEVEAGNPANWVIPGYLVMFTFFAAAQSAAYIVRERQNNTLERLLASSATKESILGGMFGGAVAKGMIQIIVFWVVGVLVFKLDMGLSPLAVILLSVLMVLVSASFSIMLATFTRTEKSSSALGVLVGLVLAPLGGCWWPLFITPQWMQFIAKLIPHGWATTGFNEVMVFGADFNAVVPNILVLAGFAVLFGIIAIARFRTSAL